MIEDFSVLFDPVIPTVDVVVVVVVVAAAEIVDV